MARQAYTEYTLASPLARVSLQTKVPEPLRDSKWARLERRVMTLLLGTMQKAAKEDAITHRIVFCFASMSSTSRVEAQRERLS